MGAWMLSHPGTTLLLSIVAVALGCALLIWGFLPAEWPEKRTEEEAAPLEQDAPVEAVVHVGATEEGLQIPADVSAQQASADEEAAIDRAFAAIITELHTEPEYLTAFIDNSMRLPAYRAFRLESTGEISRKQLAKAMRGRR